MDQPHSSSTPGGGSNISTHMWGGILAVGECDSIQWYCISMGHYQVCVISVKWYIIKEFCNILRMCVTWHDVCRSVLWHLVRVSEWDHTCTQHWRGLLCSSIHLLSAEYSQTYTKVNRLLSGREGLHWLGDHVTNNYEGSLIADGGTVLMCVQCPHVWHVRWWWEE